MKKSILISILLCCMLMTSGCAAALAPALLAGGQMATMSLASIWGQSEQELNRDAYDRPSPRHPKPRPVEIATKRDPVPLTSATLVVPQPGQLLTGPERPTYRE